jgi:hypothetical protein
MPSRAYSRPTLYQHAQRAPAPITAWRFARLLKATYWNVHLFVTWMAQDLLATLPPPSNRILYLIGDGSQADKRGAKNPVAQKCVFHGILPPNPQESGSGAILVILGESPQDTAPWAPGTARF